MRCFGIVVSLKEALHLNLPFSYISILRFCLLVELWGPLLPIIPVATNTTATSKFGNSNNSGIPEVSNMYWPVGQRKFPG